MKKRWHDNPWLSFATYLLLLWITWLIMRRQP
jgi:hypothetical protein